MEFNNGLFQRSPWFWYSLCFFTNIKYFSCRFYCSPFIKKTKKNSHLPLRRAALHRHAVWEWAKSYFPVALTLVKTPRHGLKIMFLISIIESKLTIKHECVLYKKDQLQQMYTTNESRDLSDLSCPWILDFNIAYIRILPNKINSLKKWSACKFWAYI